jgi:siderophore synthetase component
VTELLRSVLNTLLREDFRGIVSSSSIVAGRLSFRGLSLRVQPDGFLCDVAVAEPVVYRDGERLADLGSVLAAFRDLVDPVDLTGFDAFVTECHEAGTAMRLQATHRESVLARATGNLRYDTLAAHAGHPVYPTGHARRGISPEDQLRYAPEYHPEFRLRWTPVPADRVTTAGTLPGWWPTAAELGMPDDVVSFPVHPLSAHQGVEHLTVAPTLSMRTVQVDPRTHVKVPLPTSTLGLLNRRTIKPGTLVDGAVTQRLLSAIVADEPRFAERVLFADEQTYGHAGDEHLAYLVRRFPDVGQAAVVPLAALTAHTATGGLVLDELTDDRTALVTEYLALLLDYQVTLLLRYGIALESHQQNVSLVLDDRLRLLVKDNDGPRIRAELDPPVDDRRILVDGTDPLIDVFVTITLHLCAAAIVFAAGDIDRRLIRELLCAAIERHPDSPDRRLLLDRTVHADRLPVKAMVTAGTLLTKRRSGAADINKCYRLTGPNYL